MAIIIIAIAVVVLVCVIVVKAYAEASCYSSNSIASKAQWTWHILCCEKEQLQPRGLNKTNAALAAMFTMLSAVLLHSWFFVAAVMAVNGTHVEGMGWILVGLYTLGTLGCVAYSLSFGSHVMNRPMLPPASNVL